ncbi:hypothetical protein [Pontibacter pamirensis]|uniref:hypothetical protein n=1 Tax=Pontibacter pamirensis TaxID=2562824 RepID=UPI0013896077|nr:hypothetical protein [Pontibacter pamirensis]
MKRVFDAYDKDRKNSDIRELIVSDLKKQKQGLLEMDNDIVATLPMVLDKSEGSKGSAESGDKTTTQYPFSGYKMEKYVDTDIFKSHTRMEFFKAFHEEDFHLLSSIYRRIQLYEELNLIGLHEKISDKIQHYTDVVYEIMKETDTETLLERLDRIEYNVKNYYSDIHSTLETLHEESNVVIPMINKLIQNIEMKYDVIF